MAKAPSALFRREDFGDLTDPGTVDRFLRMLNGFAGDTSTALKKGLSLGENAQAFWKTLDMTSAATSFKNTLSGKPRAVFIAGAYDTATKAPVSLSSPAWATKDDQVVISAITGFPGAKTTVTFLVVGG
ncbi:MAG: hypothetical protein JXA90_08995 [Planctomycetes bacterium]|nr:hypothetical protein [Planctomycetota bacterium]